MRNFCRHFSGLKALGRKYGIRLITVLWCGWAVTAYGCSSTGRRVAPQLAAPPTLSSEAMTRQGEVVPRRLAPDPVRYDIPPATMAVLIDEVARDMGWKEHSILYEEREGSYTVAMSEGTTWGVQRRVSITPKAQGSEVLILPPDEGISVRIKERAFAYLTGLSSGDADVSPQVKHLPHSFSRVWRATKETLIDGGFSFKTTDEDVGFIETDRVPLGKARRSWFGGVGQVGLIARPPSMNYEYASVEWRYRIRVQPASTRATEVSVEAVVEATPDSSTLERLSSGALDLLSVPFGSWISSAATGSSSSRVVLPSRGRLERQFFTGLTNKLSGETKKPSAARRAKK